MTTHDNPRFAPSNPEAEAPQWATPPVGQTGRAATAPVGPGAEMAAPPVGQYATDAPTAFGQQPSGATPPAGGTEQNAGHLAGDGERSSSDALFAEDELADMRGRWAAVQAAFVDDPKECVHKADALVSDLVDRLTSGFAHARSSLEEQWARGEESSTETLRVALMRYREFFERLLSV
ncbi:MULTISPECIES: hypothetical protein [unclassified Mycobacterium]|uniref:hypothetical protein n=1 Tax=unclassified Mycobacterium TaxID=2642494 RepID=UPI000AD62B22|nr:MULTISPECIES: hypothetical protein [unclassified Mycobacterium]